MAREEDFQQIIFDDKTVSQLFKDIYVNSKDKDEKISSLIDELRPLIKTMKDASFLVPLVKEYLDVSIKNDEHLIKLAAVVQRLLAKDKVDGGTDSLLTDEEKEELLGIAKETFNDSFEEKQKAISKAQRGVQNEKPNE